jgi:hypothetical protein
MSVPARENVGVAAHSRQAESVEPASGLPKTVLRDVRLLLIALWLGGAVFFSAAVATSAFGVLRERGIAYANEAAGSIVTRTLSTLNTSGFLIALFLMATAFLYHRGVRRRAFLTEVVSLLVVAIATGVGQWVIAARMLALRTAMGRPIDDVAAADPLRIAFSSLHGYSVMALGVAIIAAAVALLLIARRAKQLQSY